jgi:hypothetical protein
MQVPISPQRQYTMMDIALAHAFGGGPTFDQVQQILPGVDRYVMPNSWPRPRPTSPSTSSFSGLATTAPEPEAPRSSARARSLWPNLP